MARTFFMVSSACFGLLPQYCSENCGGIREGIAAECGGVFAGHGQFGPNDFLRFGITVRFSVARRAVDFLRGQAFFDRDKRLAIGERNLGHSPKWFSIL